MLLLKGARVIDPQIEIDEETDVLVDGERIVGVGTGLSAEGALVIDLSG